MSPPQPKRLPLSTPLAPPAVGPYSQGIRAAGLVFTAGQLGLDPVTRALVPGGIAPETNRALANLAAVLAAGGASLASVLKTTVFLADMREFAAMNEVYAAWFGAEPPARSTVEVAALPLAGRVEIEAVALAIADAQSSGTGTGTNGSPP
jgi:2-iminobutanoate/2-iminopropanoate deaminase